VVGLMLESIPSVAPSQQVQIESNMQRPIMNMMPMMPKYPLMMPLPISLLFAMLLLDNFF